MCVHVRVRACMRARVHLPADAFVFLATISLLSLFIGIAFSFAFYFGPSYWPLLQEGCSAASVAAAAAVAAVVAVVAVVAAVAVVT